MKKHKPISKKRLKNWIDWAHKHLKSGRIDPFLQGWRCAFAVIMAFEGIPKDVRVEICKAISHAESALWKRTRKDRY